MKDMSLALRTATPQDEPFLMKVYASTRQEELDLTQWDQTQRAAFIEMQYKAQCDHYRASFPEAEHQVILFNADAIGRLYIARQERAIRILDITILPERRN